ncbi:hypothetical protein LJR225_000728 [Phenylobacterium sp. LjRoot225]|uniref:hypothetical protein n=1 Tax=Phenylobacterium sp. LjRoot225 TaxID=3342285 RepID=UPI003ECE0AF2
MSDDDTISAEERAAMERPGVFANQVFLNVIDGMVRLSFGLKAGGQVRFTDAVTVSPGLALALLELIDTYVPPPTKAPAKRKSKNAPWELAPGRAQARH